jgi:hypothetical protein
MNIVQKLVNLLDGPGSVENAAKPPEAILPLGTKPSGMYEAATRNGSLPSDDIPATQAGIDRMNAELHPRIIPQPISALRHLPQPSEATISTVVEQVGMKPPKALRDKIGELRATWKTCHDHATDHVPVKAIEAYAQHMADLERLATENPSELVNVEVLTKEGLHESFKQKRRQWTNRANLISDEAMLILRPFAAEFAQKANAFADLIEKQERDLLKRFSLFESPGLASQMIRKVAETITLELEAGSAFGRDPFLIASHLFKS